MIRSVLTKSCAINRLLSVPHHPRALRQQISYSKIAYSFSNSKPPVEEPKSQSNTKLSSDSDGTSAKRELGDTEIPQSKQSTKLQQNNYRRSSFKKFTPLQQSDKQAYLNQYNDVFQRVHAADKVIEQLKSQVCILPTHNFTKELNLYQAIEAHYEEQAELRRERSPIESLGFWLTCLYRDYVSAPQKRLKRDELATIELALNRQLEMARLELQQKVRMLDLIWKQTSIETQAIKRQNIKSFGTDLIVVSLKFEELQRVLREEDPQDLAEGVRMTNKILIKTLEWHGFKRIEPKEDDRFDESEHERVDSQNKHKGKIVEVLQKGWKFGDEVIAQAKVKLSK